MSTVDTADGFWHSKVDESSSKQTTMETPWGRHRWTRMCFGLSVAPEIFQACLQAALSGLKRIAVIVDDILIYGLGDTEAMIDHNNNLKALLQRCREKNIKLNKKKLSSEPVLAYFDLTKPITVQADCSSFAVGDVYCAMVDRWSMRHAG